MSKNQNLIKSINNGKFFYFGSTFLSNLNDIDIYKKEMLNRWEELPQMFYTSSIKEMGQKEILSYIGQTNTLFQ